MVSETVYKTTFGFWTSSYLSAGSNPYIYEISGYGAYVMFAPSIPRGSVITTATLGLYIFESSGGDWSPRVEIYCEDVGDANTPTSRADAISKTRTTANVYTTIDVFGPAGYRTKNVKSLVEEIIARSDWSAGNNMQFLIDGAGSANEYAGANQAYLDLIYTPPSGGKVRIIGMGL